MDANFSSSPFFTIPIAASPENRPLLLFEALNSPAHFQLLSCPGRAPPFREASFITSSRPSSSCPPFVPIRVLRPSPNPVKINKGWCHFSLSLRPFPFYSQAQPPHIARPSRQWPVCPPTIPPSTDFPDSSIPSFRFWQSSPPRLLRPFVKLFDRVFAPFPPQINPNIYSQPSALGPRYLPSISSISPSLTPLIVFFS